MTILIVYLSLIYIYSIMLILSHLSLIIMLNKICFIYLEVATERSSIKCYISSTLELNKLKYARESFSKAGLLHRQA